MTKIIDVEGIGKVYAQKLKEAGLSTVEALLKEGASLQGRTGIEQKTGISHKLILEWVNLADLFRIKGIGEEYSDLLEEAGVDTVIELAQRNAENLHQKLVEINKQKKLVRQIPGLSQVTKWVEQAKKLPRVVTY
jgi:predicted flap endonuclease-1-like 5' DNA nuclease